MFITRAYNSFKYNPDYQTLKKVSKENKLKDEIEYLTTLPVELSIFFPRIMDEGESTDGYWIEMEKYAYRTLGDIMVYDEFNEGLWLKIIKQINKALAIFSEYECSKNKDVKKHRSAMYIEKTEREYKKLCDGYERFRVICSNDEIEINGKTCINFYGMWGKLINYMTNNVINDNTFSIIHGDMCFSNILCGQIDDDVIIKFIDPRGSFGMRGIYGDQLYDYAKLRHSYEGGYEYMIYNQFNVAAANDLKSFVYSFTNYNKDKIAKIFSKAQPDKHSKLVEGLIFIGMCARHYDSSDRQLIMYLTGIKLLNEFIKENGL